jgi:hypothetical protein
MRLPRFDRLNCLPFGLVGPNSPPHSCKASIKPAKITDLNLPLPWGNQLIERLSGAAKFSLLSTKHW